MSKTNFKTFESQQRLLAAVIASDPSIKLNFKEIAKYYGESTPGGLEFQFRSIKRDAKTLKAAYDSGGNPATALSGTTSTPQTPRSVTKRKAGGAKSGGSTAKKIKKEVDSFSAALDDLQDQDEEEPTPSKKSRQRSVTMEAPAMAHQLTPESETLGSFDTPVSLYDGGFDSFPLKTEQESHQTPAIYQSLEGWDQGDQSLGGFDGDV